MSASNPLPDDICNRCSHRRELHRPDCHYSRPHGTPPNNVCRVGHPLIGPCPGFVETSEPDPTRKVPIDDTQSEGAYDTEGS